MNYIKDNKSLFFSHQSTLEDSLNADKYSAKINLDTFYECNVTNKS